MKVSECVPGTRVGLLTIIETFKLWTDTEKVPRHVNYCLTKCECGALKTVSLSHIGKSVRSCGCLHKAVAASTGVANRTHGWASGKYRTVYNSCVSAMARCRKPQSKMWEHYGGRGIEFRFESPAEMAEYIVFGIEHGTDRCLDRAYSIDRINNDGHYERGNLRWATYSEQSYNQRKRKDCRK